MGYDNIIIRRQWLIERIEWLYKNGKMSLDEYQRLKKLVDSDIANDIVCTITLPICRTLMVMAAVESCR